MIAHLSTVPVALVLTLTASAQVTNADIPRDNHKGRWINHNVEPLAPIAWAPDSSLFYIANTHDSSIAVFNPVTMNSLAEIPVGPGIASIHLRPGANELWCVDRVTSSVTVIDLSIAVIRYTIPVGDGPHGLAFTASGDRAYVSCSAVDQVDVIDAGSYSVVNSIDIPARDPRAIVRVGGAIYVASHLSGNGTAPIGAPGSGGAQPSVEVRHVTEFPGTNPLPDRDLFVIPITSDPTTDLLDPTRTVTEIGTILRNAHMRPGTSEIWIPHTDALNGVIQGDKNFIEGQVVRNRIAVFDPINPANPTFIDLDNLAPTLEHRCSPATGIAFHDHYAFAAGYGSHSVMVMDTATTPVTWVGTIRVIQERITPSVSLTPEQDGAGPRVPTISPDGQYLVILNSGEGSVTKVELSDIPFNTPGFEYVADEAERLGWDPLPREIVQGRIDFARTKNSASRTSSCESCHVGGHTDGLSWDLSGFLDEEGTPRDEIHLPIDHKGPLFTQSARRLREVGPWHWRGEQKSLMDFDGAFVGLLERISPTTGETASLGIQFNYTQRYMDTIAWPANPNTPADREYTQAQLEGADLYMNKPVRNGLACVDCHSLPLGTSGEIVDNTVGGLTTTTVIPPLRGVAEKLLSPLFVVGGDFGERTELGTGLGHAGSEASWLTHLLAQPGGTQRHTLSAAEAIKIVDFLKAFDTGLAPSTAFQVTADATNATSVLANELTYLMDQADLGHCDLIYRAGAFSGLYDPARRDFGQASVALPRLDALSLINQAIAGTPITFIGVPLWTGYSTALDSDNDRILDLDEATFGTNPRFWDTDHDFRPDGYETLHGTDPLDPTSRPNDTTAPGVNGQPEIIFRTQNTIKFEFRTNELAKILVSYDGGLPVLRAPIYPFYDDRFSVIVNRLEPGTQYNLEIEMEDPSGNISQVILSTSTTAMVAPAPIYIEDVSLAHGAANALNAQVELTRDGSLPVGLGYTVHAAIYRIPFFGLPTVITDDVSAAVNGNGQANFSLQVPSAFRVRGGGLYYFIVHTVDGPAGGAVYVEANDIAHFDSLTF
ncbi:MAG: hypothetical protein GY711_04225 [bacterium]|nr:hypothetical protein [bacterium]